MNKIAPEQQNEHVSMKIPTVAKEQDYIWRLITDDIEATIVQEFSKPTFSYGTTETQRET